MTVIYSQQMEVLPRKIKYLPFLLSCQRQLKYKSLNMGFKLFAFGILFPALLYAQSTNVPLNEDYYHWIDRYEIKAGRVVSPLFTSVKPYKRSALVAFIDSLKTTDQVFVSPADQYNYQYLQNDSWEWGRPATNNSRKPLLKNLYHKKSDLAFVDQPDFDIHVNPVLYVGVGNDSRQGQALFINTRGAEIRGMIDGKIGFYTFLTDNQARLPSFVQDGIAKNPVIPHEGFWKDFKSNGVDFFQARAYIDFNLTRHIYMQFGHDRTFIGNGYRSLIFSDHAPPALFLRTNLKIWKINYLFQLTRMAADAPGSIGGTSSGSRSFPEKFMAFHHASINIGKKLNIGIFESVIFSQEDSLNNNSFDLSYLNPVIFFRAIEQQFGSSDNVIIGMDYKWNAAKGVAVYGQLVIDEFLLDRIKDGNGWWANKFGVQTGVKFIDVAGISNLDVQLESNIVRPYTYSHNTPFGSYTSYRQPIAHPLGANFYELLTVVRYQPRPKINITAKAFYAKVGRDTTGVNWGGDLLKSNSTREQDFGNSIGQGIANKIAHVNLTVSYMLRHNFFIDLNQGFRNSRSADPFYRNNTATTSIALRWNISQRLYDF